MPVCLANAPTVHWATWVRCARRPTPSLRLGRTYVLELLGHARKVAPVQRVDGLLGQLLAVCAAPGTQKSSRVDAAGVGGRHGSSCAVPAQGGVAAGLCLSITPSSAWPGSHGGHALWWGALRLRRALHRPTFTSTPLDDRLALLVVGAQVRAQRGPVPAREAARGIGPGVAIARCAPLTAGRSPLAALGWITHASSIMAELAAFVLILLSSRRAPPRSARRSGRCAAQVKLWLGWRAARRGARVDVWALRKHNICCGYVSAATVLKPHMRKSSPRSEQTRAYSISSCKSCVLRAPAKP